MGLRQKLQSARKFIAGLDSQERLDLEAICEDIRDAQNLLLANGDAVLNRCRDGCGGICCRNLNTDEIIFGLDFIFILSVDPGIADPLEACLHAVSLYTEDCRFLQNGQGPCLLPAAARPEQCFLTFCGDASSIKKEIRLVRSQFGRLQRHILLWRLRAAIKKPFSLLSVVKG